MSPVAFPPIETMTPAEVAAELADHTAKHSFRRPARSKIDPARPWLFGAPDYDNADLLFFRGRTKLHPEGSLPDIVENAVKTWEMEASHLPFAAWCSVDHAKYRVSANGARTFVGEDGAAAGNYNWLLAGADTELYDSDAHTFESSHELFRGAFKGGFPWELLEVFSGPPRIAFSWRHWATFDGVYRGREGDGKEYEMYGWGVVTVNEELKIQEIEIFYKPDEFLRAMQGGMDPEDLANGKGLIGCGCPFLAGSVGRK